MSILIWAGTLLTVAGASGLISCFVRQSWHPEVYVQAPVSVLDREFLTYFDDDLAPTPTLEQRDKAVMRVIASVVALGLGALLLGFGLAASIPTPTF